MTDDRMDARLRAAGERWRTANTTTAVIEPIVPAEPADLLPSRPTRRRWGLLASAAAVAVALVVGGTFLLRDAHHGATPSGDTAALEGHVWLLTDQHATNSTATLYIDRAGNLVADDECTLIGGKAALDGETMTVTNQIVRSKSCTDQYGPGYRTDGTAVLDGASTFTITADALTISRNGKELRFQLAPQTTPVPTLDVPTLVGASWVLVSAKDADGNPVTVAGDPTLHLADDGTLSGSDGCNSLTGTVTLDGNRITFGQVGGTEKYCPGDAGATETAILAVMRGTAHETVVGGELTMTKGNAELVYRWQPASSDATDPAQLQGVRWHLVDDGNAQLPSDTTVDFSGANWELFDGTLRPRTADASDPLAALFASSWHPWFVRDDRLFVLLNDAQASALVFAIGALPSVVPTPPNAVTLVGPTWHLVSIRSGDGRYRNGAPPAEDSTVTVTDSGFTVHHSCYTQQGSAATTKDTVTFGDAHATDAHPCPFTPGRDEAANVVDTILSGAVTWTIDGGTLTLINSGTGTLVYSTTRVTSGSPLAGTEWKLETAVGDHGTEYVAAGQTFEIGGSGRPTMSMTDGLNTTSGPVEVHDGTLTFGDLATTAIGSTQDDPVRDVIDEVIQHGDVTYDITGNALTLSRGAAQLIYRA